MFSRVLCRDSLTAWRDAPGGCARTVYTGVRVQEGESSRPSVPGPARGAELSAWLFTPAGIRPGDYVAAGVRADADPPDDARRVESVAPRTVSGAAHHVKVVAR